MNKSDSELNNYLIVICPICERNNLNLTVSGNYLKKLIDNYKISHILINPSESYHLECLCNKFPGFAHEFIKGKENEYRRYVKTLIPNQNPQLTLSLKGLHSEESTLSRNSPRLIASPSGPDSNRLRQNKGNFINFKVVNTLLNEFLLGVVVLNQQNPSEKYQLIIKHLIDLLGVESNSEIIKSRVIQHQLIDYQDHEAGKALLKLLLD